MSMVLKKLVTSKHVLPHMAPELLMGSVVYTESCEAWSIGSLFSFYFHAENYLLVLVIRLLQVVTNRLPNLALTRVVVIY